MSQVEAELSSAVQQNKSSAQVSRVNSYDACNIVKERRLVEELDGMATMRRFSSERDVQPTPMTDIEGAPVRAREEKPLIDEADYPEGGLKGWMAVTGSWLAMLVTFGYVNTFGVYQSYYQTAGYPSQTASDISWVGSIQLFLQFALGVLAGPLYDKGYFYTLVISGSVIYVVCLFMTSLCTAFWQVILAQAFGVGIGIGLLFLPAISILSQYFAKRRSFAIGIAVTGSSVGGIVHPIMLNNLIASQGFKKAVQYSAILTLGCCVLSIALMWPRLAPHPHAPPRPSIKEIFSSAPYCLVVAGLYFIEWGLFFPVYYIQVYAEQNNISPAISNYTLAILNAASVLGRIAPNFLADYWGPLNCMAVMTFGGAAMCFSMFGAKSETGIIVVCVLFGFFSGSYASLLSPSLIVLAKNQHEIGIRLGMGYTVTSIAALTGTPIAGALLDRYGFYAAFIWSGVTVVAGMVSFALAAYLQGKVKGTWKV